LRTVLVRREDARVVTAPRRRAGAVDLVVVAVDEPLDGVEEVGTRGRVQTGRAVRVDLARIAGGRVVLALAVGGRGQVVLAVVLRRVVGEGSLRALLVAAEDARGRLAEVLRDGVLALREALVRRDEPAVVSAERVLRDGQPDDEHDGQSTKSNASLLTMCLTSWEPAARPVSAVRILGPVFRALRPVARRQFENHETCGKKA